MRSIKTGYRTIRGGAGTVAVAGTSAGISAGIGIGAIGWLCWWELCLRLRIVLVVGICWISGRDCSIVV